MSKESNKENNERDIFIELMQALAISAFIKKLKEVHDSVEVFSREPDDFEKATGEKVQLLSARSVIYLHEVLTEKPAFDTTDGVDKEQFEEINNFARDKVFIITSDTVHYEFKCGHCQQTHEANLIIDDLETGKRYFVDADDVVIYKED